MIARAHKLVLFDLDGVLVDSREAMRIAWETVRRELDVNVPFVAYFQEIGRPFPQIIDRLGLSGGLADIERVYKSVTFAEVARALAYPHVDETLRRLVDGGARVGVVTSKSRLLSIETLRQFSTPLTLLRTPDDGPGKPAPDLLLSAMAAAGAHARETVYVGDMAVDLQAARAARVRFLHAAWGYGSCPAGTPRLRDIRDIARLGDGVRAGFPLSMVDLGSRSLDPPPPGTQDHPQPLPMSSSIARSPKASSPLKRSAGSRLIPSERRRAACSSNRGSRL